MLVFPRRTLSFLSLFLWKKAGKTTKKTRIFYPYRTPKSLEKKGKNAQKKTRNSSQGEKTQGIPKKQGRTGRIGPFPRVARSCDHLRNRKGFRFAGRKTIASRALSEYCFACGSRTRFHLRGYRNRTRNQSKPYSRPAQTVVGNSRNRTRSVLGQRHVSFPFLWDSQEKRVEN